MKNTLSIDLKSNSYAGMLSSVIFFTLIFIIVIWNIIQKSLELLSRGDVSLIESFPFIIISLLGLIIPIVFNLAVGKNLIFRDICRIDLEAQILEITEKNVLNHSLITKKQFDIAHLNELIYIRINEDEDGIVNNYHIFLTFSDGQSQKMYTFQKFHFAKRFITVLSEQTQFRCLDWTDLNFAGESDFFSYYKMNKPE